MLQRRLGLGGGGPEKESSWRRRDLTEGAPRTAGGEDRWRGGSALERVGSGAAAADGVEKGSSRAFGRKGCWWARWNRLARGSARLRRPAD